MSDRFKLLSHWLTNVLTNATYDIVELSGDASFRRYYRVRYGADSYIVMDAPPDQLNCQPFITNAALFKTLGVHVPEIWASDLAHGFLLLSDFGDCQYFDILDSNNADGLYNDALKTLALFQTQSDPIPSDWQLPDYDQALLMRELEIFREWVLQNYLSITLNDREQQSLEQMFQLLCANALEQPRVLVHRDYHSRNLMVTTARNPGVLDFQDAVYGPLTYDLVSLLRDCYIAWPRKKSHRLGFSSLCLFASTEL